MPSASKRQKPFEPSGRVHVSQGQSHADPLGVATEEHSGRERGERSPGWVATRPRALQRRAEVGRRSGETAQQTETQGGKKGGLAARMGPAADAAAEGGDHARHVLDFGEPKAWPAGRAGGQSPCGSSEDICESEDREMLLPHCGKQVGGQTMGAREAVRLSTRSLVSQAPPEPATGTSPANRPTRWRRPGP